MLRSFSFFDTRAVLSIGFLGSFRCNVCNFSTNFGIEWLENWLLHDPRATMFAARHGGTIGRERALRLVRAYENPTSVEILSDLLLNDEWSYIRAVAFDYLSEIKDDRVFSLFVKATQDKSWEFRKSAIKFLSSFGSKAIDPIRELLRSEDKDVSYTAKDALKKLGCSDDELLLSLKTNLRESDSDLSNLWRGVPHSVESFRQAAEKFEADLGLQLKQDELRDGWKIQREIRIPKNFHKVIKEITFWYNSEDRALYTIQHIPETVIDVPTLIETWEDPIIALRCSQFEGGLQNDQEALRNLAKSAEEKDLSFDISAHHMKSYPILRILLGFRRSIWPKPFYFEATPDITFGDVQGFINGLIQKGRYRLIFMYQLEVDKYASVDVILDFSKEQFKSLKSCISDVTMYHNSLPLEIRDHKQAVKEFISKMPL